jgi:hypothetical protein
MPFRIFKKEGNGNATHYSDTGTPFRLAGNKNGLLYKLWNKKKPGGPEWSVTSDDLLKEFSAEYGTDNHALVTVLYENSESIGLAEIEAVHAYTDEGTYDYWSVVMLELRQIYNGLVQGPKEEFLKGFMPSNVERIVEFLYLKDGWGWGRNGSTNGALIYDNARKYFQSVFNRDYGRMENC